VRARENYSRAPSVLLPDLHLTPRSDSSAAPVYVDGRICLDILASQWTPIYDVTAILTSIQSLLNDPNPNSPANAEAAQLYSENRREYNRRVAEMVEQSFEDGDGEEDEEEDDDESGAGGGAGAAAAED